MTDLLSDVFFFRGVERWMIVLGGVFFAYLGYRLFLFGVDKGHGKLASESPFFKVTFSGSGPGLFFMAFGALVLVNSINSDATRTEETAGAARAAASAQGETNAVPFAKETTSFSNKGALSVCELLSANQGNVEDILWTYENRVDSEKMKHLADSLENHVRDERARQELLIAVQEVICELE